MIRAEEDAPADFLAHEGCHRGCTPRARRESLTSHDREVKVLRRGASTRRAVPCSTFVLVQPTSRPTPAELAAAAELVLDDVLASGLQVVFCGINPSL